jgi:hypothetical protein
VTPPRAHIYVYVYVCIYIYVYMHIYVGLELRRYRDTAARSCLVVCASPARSLVFSAVCIVN